MADTFLVLVTGTTKLSKSEIWPDGDAPENPTAADLSALMETETLSTVLEEWALIEDLDVEIYADTSYARPFSAEPRDGVRVAS